MSFLRDTVQMLLWRGVAIVLGALTAVYVARWLGPVDRGHFALMVLWVGLGALVLQAGIPEASIYLIGTEQYPQSQVVSSILLWFSAVAAAGAAACFAVSVGVGLPGTTALLLSCVLALLVLTAALRHFLMARREFNRYSLSVVIEVGANLALLAALHRAQGLRPDLALAAYMASLATSMAILLVWLPRGSLAPPGWRVRAAILASAARNGVHLFLTGLGGFGVQRIGYLLLEWFSGVRSVGMFAAASALPVLFSNLPQQLATVLYSHTSASGAEHGARLAVAVFQFLTVLGLLFLLPLYVMRDDVAVLLFGPEFAGIGDAIALLSAGMLMTGLNGVLFNALAGSGFARVGGRLTVLTLSLMTILGCILIPPFGLAGAAWAQCGAAAVSLAVVSIIFCRRLRVPFKVLFTPAIADLREGLWWRGARTRHEHD